MGGELLEKTRGIINKDRAEDIRAMADESNDFCLYASLCEMASLVKHGSVPRRDQLLKEYTQKYGRDLPGGVCAERFFDLLEEARKNRGISVEQIFANPSFIDHYKVPDDYEPLIKRFTGKLVVPLPYVVILAKKHEGKWWPHAETMDGSERTKARYDELMNSGFSVGMALTFKATSVR